MDTETRPSPAGVPVPLDARVVPLPAPAPPAALRAGDLASEAAAIHAGLCTLLIAKDAGDRDVLDGLAAAEAGLERLRRRLAGASFPGTARCTLHLLRDAHRSIRDACALVDDELARRSAGGSLTQS